MSDFKGKITLGVTELIVNSPKDGLYNEKCILLFYCGVLCVDMSKFYPKCREGWMLRYRKRMKISLPEDILSQPLNENNKASELLNFANKLEDEHKDKGYKWLYDRLRYEIIKVGSNVFNCL